MFYYSDGHNDVGPFNLQRLKELRAVGIISDQTLVRLQGGDSWLFFEQVLNDFSYPKKDGEPFGGSSSTVPTLPDDLHATKEYALILDQGAVHEQPSQPNETKKWLSEPSTPWRRYAARLLDSGINGLLAWMLVGTVFFALVPNTAVEFFSKLEEYPGVFELMFSTILASLIGGALLGASGSTLGKWVFGIRVTMADGSKLGISNGIKRDLLVAVVGLGCAFPLISLLCMFIAYRALKKNGTTWWDNNKYIVWHRPSSSIQTILNIVGVFMIIGIIMLVRALSEL